MTTEEGAWSEERAVRYDQARAALLNLIGACSGYLAAEPGQPDLVAERREAEDRLLGLEVGDDEAMDDAAVYAAGRLADLERRLLTIGDMEVLRIGCAFYEDEGAILNEIHATGLSQEKFYQRLNALLDTEKALAFDPVNVNRLRRLRDERTDRRSR